MKQPCWKCGGTGIVRNEGSTAYETVCPICGGTGYLEDMVHVIEREDTCKSGLEIMLDDILERIKKLENQLEAIVGLMGEKDEYMPTKTTTCATGDDLSCTD